MEDEIDLRAYINTLLCYKWLIIALTVVFGVVAFVVTLFLPTTYQATAVVVITRPLYQIQFSPAIQNLPEPVSMQLTGKTGLDLASSDTMLQQVLDSVGNDQLPQEYSIPALREILKAVSGSDPSVVKLIVTNRNPQRAAKIANAWAGLYIRQVNDLYGQSGEQLKFFEGQLVQAQSDLDKADQALIDLQKRNDTAILQARLSAKQGSLSNYLGMNESLTVLSQNIHSLQDQLSGQPADAPSTLGDDLSALMLQINVFNAQIVGTPIQLQLSSAGTLSNKTAGQQAAYLANLAKTIETKQAEIKKQADSLPAEILALQGKIQEITVESDRLTRQRELAQSTYKSLAQKVEETRIAAQDNSGRVRLASSAAVPERPISKNRLVNTAVAAAAGLFLGILGALAIEYFRQPQPPKPAER